MVSLSFFKYYIANIMLFEIFWLREETGILTVSNINQGQSFCKCFNTFKWEVQQTFTINKIKLVRLLQCRFMGLTIKGIEEWIPETSLQGYERPKKCFLEINILIHDQTGLVDCNSGTLTGVTQRSLSKRFQF